MKVLIVGLFLWITHLAQAGSIAAKVDRTVLTSEDEVQLVITVSGKFSGEPQIAKIAGLEINRVGQSSRMSMTFGSMSSETDFIFIIRPEKDGDYLIPSIAFSVDGKTEKTLPINLHVKSDLGASKDSAAKQKEVSIMRELSEKEIFVGQAVKVETKIVSQAEVLQIGGGMPDPASMQRFRNEEKQVQMRRELQKGVEISTLAILDVLIPNKAGDLEVPVAKYVLKLKSQPSPSARQRGLPFFEDDDGGFFGLGRRFREVRSQAASQTIKVRPLPPLEPGKVFSGLVGSFVADVEVSAREAKVGDSLTVTVRISGDGIIDTVLDHLNFNFPPNFKVYPDKPESQLQVNANFANGLRTEKTFKYALVPTQAGEFNVDDLDLTVFSPKMGIYASLSASFGTLKISDDSKRVVETQPTSPQLGTVVQPVAPGVKAEKPLAAQEMRGSYDSLQVKSQLQIDRLFWIAVQILFVLPFCVFVFAFLWLTVVSLFARRRRPPSAVEMMVSNATKLIAKIATASPTELFVGLKDVLAGYMETQPHAASRSDFLQAVVKAKLNTAESDAALKCFDHLEKATITGSEDTDSGSETRRQLSELLHSLIKGTEK